jgi:hypothetical protein
VSNDVVFANDELKSIWKETVVFCFHPGIYLETMRDKSRYLISRQIFKPSFPKYESGVPITASLYQAEKFHSLL